MEGCPGVPMEGRAGWRTRGKARGTSMRRVRALVVEESVVSRLILSAMLESDPAIEVVGTASTGALALGRILETNPDVVTFDVETPEAGGPRPPPALPPGPPPPP